MSLGDKIKAARDRLRWSQQQLADAIGVDRKTVDNWEHGRTRPLRAHLAALERILGPLKGGPDDLYTIADDIRQARELSPGQRQVLLELLGAEPHGRHSLIPMPVLRDL